jgi:20S proteasome alpha/beta subunit
MTLVAAFRCANGGVLLCADKQEDDGIAKREVDKIYRIQAGGCYVFIAGAGPSSVIQAAQTEIHTELLRAVQNGPIDMLRQHRGIIEGCLRSIHKLYGSNIKPWPMELLIVFQVIAPGMAPILYRTEKALMIHEPFYAAYGSGKTISDYFADRLHRDRHLNKPSLMAVAGFILREAERSASGVGLGGDMVFIRGGTAEYQLLGPDSVKELQDAIPALSDAIWNYWKDHAGLPGWTQELNDGPMT